MWPTWHLSVDPAGRPGAENMALDQALLDEADRTAHAFLRLYRWDPPCLSFGRNEQALARYDRSAIERLGLDVVRRPTGGRAVWHHHEVTYAVAAPVEAFGSVRQSYRTIHEWLAQALRELGVRAELAPAGGMGAGGACFAAPVGGEVLVAGNKVIGSAQVRQGVAFLQHGSILLDGTQEIISRVSRRPSPPPNATTLSQVLGRPMSFEEVAAAIVRAWNEAGAQHAVPLPPSARPPVRLSACSDPRWTWRR